MIGYGRAGTGSRVTGSPGQWFCPGRVGSRVKVIYLHTRYRDPVSGRTTEWYSSCFYAGSGNTWTHCAKSALSEHTYPSVTVKEAVNCLIIAPTLPLYHFKWQGGVRCCHDIKNPSRLPTDYYSNPPSCRLLRPQVLQLERNFSTAGKITRKDRASHWQLKLLDSRSVSVGCQAIKKNLLTWLNTLCEIMMADDVCMSWRE